MVFRSVSKENVSLLPVFIAGTLCTIFSRGGLLFVFSLVPLAFVCFRYNLVTAWAAFVAASCVNIIMTLMGIAALQVPVSMVFVDFLFFIAMTGIFTWINAPLSFGGKIIPGVTRFVTGSLLAALIFILVLIRKLNDQFVLEALYQQINGVITFYQSTSQDVVQRAMFDSLTAESLIELSKAVLFRGGALAAMIFIFWMSRQLGILFTRFTRNPYRTAQLVSFRADSRLIWVFSVSLVLVLLFRSFTAPPLEIVLWNILTLCVILYFAQGLGVLQYFISRPAVSPFLRFLLIVVFVFLLFSQGINRLVLGGVILLGIIENWVFIRRPRPNGPPSTPEV